MKLRNRGESEYRLPLTPSGFDAPRPRRPLRTFLILGVLVVLVVAGAGGYLLFGRDDGPTQQRRAVAAATTYFAAWSRADDTAVTAGSVTGSEPIVTAMKTLRTDLGVTKAVYTGGTVTRKGSDATVPYTAALTLTGLGTYDYSGQLALRRDGNRWLAAPVVVSVHPELVNGQKLAVVRNTGTRGKLLDVSGTPLNQDTELAGNLVGSAGTTAADGTVSGQTGLERVFDAQLAGTPGGSIVVKDTAGATARTLKDFGTTPGKDVTTTLDLRVQRAGELAMAGVIQPNGALAAVDTRTGGVLALVNHPLNGFPRATQGKYAPGSTFKIITATAALMSGKTETSPTQCAPTATINGRTFQNAEGETFGAIPLRTAFAKSCNTSFVNLDLGLPAGALQTAARLFGFDDSQPLAVRSAGGSYPETQGKDEEAGAAIGQSKVTASPMQMASVAAAVSSGTWRQPFVQGAPKVTHPLPSGVAPALQDMMRAVVTEGTAAGIPFPAGTAGKTGTAEYSDTLGPNGQRPTNAWFAGYHDTVAFAVIVEDGGFGADTAAPAAQRFLAALG